MNNLELSPREKSTNRRELTVLHGFQVSGKLSKCDSLAMKAGINIVGNVKRV